MRGYPDQLTITPVSRPVDTVVSLPGSKSYTNRALLIAALAEGESVIHSALFSDDTQYMAESLTRLGIAVDSDEASASFRVGGQGGRVPAKSAQLFVGNSGTSARFLTALLALGQGDYRLDGSPRMRQRPIQPLLDALQLLDVDAQAINGDGCPPLRVRGRGLSGGRAHLNGQTSSQYFSALLMVGPVTPQGLTIDVDGELVSKPYIDLTQDSMRAFGASMTSEDYRRFVVPGGQGYRGREYVVEPDASAASYFFALAAVSGGRVRVAHLGEDSVQGDLHFVDVLEQMGCRVTRAREYTEVVGPERLRGVSVDMNGISDTVQTLAAIAPLAEGAVVIRNVAHIRHKETDRLAAIVTELRRLGVAVDEWPDGLTIFPSAARPATVETYDDHRMAMSFAILGCAVPGITIDQPGCVAKTFPDFFDRLTRATGAR